MTLFGLLKIRLEKGRALLRRQPGHISGHIPIQVFLIREFFVKKLLTVCLERFRQVFQVYQPQRDLIALRRFDCTPHTVSQAEEIRRKILVALALAELDHRAPFPFKQTAD